MTSGSITVMLIFCPQWEFKALGVLSQQFPRLNVQASEGLSENFFSSWHCVSFRVDGSLPETEKGEGKKEG